MSSECPLGGRLLTATWRTCARIHLLMHPMTFEYILVLNCIELYSWVWSMVAWLFTERKIIQISNTFKRFQIFNQVSTLRTINTKLLAIFFWIKENSFWVFSSPLHYRQSYCEKLSLHKFNCTLETKKFYFIFYICIFHWNNY